MGVGVQLVAGVYTLKLTVQNWIGEESGEAVINVTVHAPVRENTIPPTPIISTPHATVISHSSCHLPGITSFPLSPRLSFLSTLSCWMPQTATTPWAQTSSPSTGRKWRALLIPPSPQTQISSNSPTSSRAATNTGLVDSYYHYHVVSQVRPLPFSQADCDRCWWSECLR